MSYPMRLLTSRAPAGSAKSESERAEHKAAAVAPVGSGVVVVDPVPTRLRATIVRTRRESAVIEFDGPANAQLYDYDLAKALCCQVPEDAWTESGDTGCYIDRIDTVDASGFVTRSALAPRGRKINDNGVGDVGEFLQFGVEEDEESQISLTDLYYAYCSWCEAGGMDPVGLADFTDDMDSSDTQIVETNGRRYFLLRPLDGHSPAVEKSCRPDQETKELPESDPRESEAPATDSDYDAIEAAVSLLEAQWADADWSDKEQQVLDGLLAMATAHPEEMAVFFDRLQALADAVVATSAPEAA